MKRVVLRKEPSSGGGIEGLLALAGRNVLFGLATTALALSLAPAALAVADTDEEREAPALEPRVFASIGSEELSEAGGRFSDNTLTVYVPEVAESDEGAAYVWVCGATHPLEAGRCEVTLPEGKVGAIEVRAVLADGNEVLARFGDVYVDTQDPRVISVRLKRAGGYVQNQAETGPLELLDCDWAAALVVDADEAEVTVADTGLSLEMRDSSLTCVSASGAVSAPFHALAPHATDAAGAQAGLYRATIRLPEGACLLFLHATDEWEHHHPLDLVMAGDAATDVREARLVVDRSAPVVQTSYESHRAQATRGAWQYFNKSQDIALHVSDRTLDADTTLLAGVPLRALLTQGNAEIAAAQARGVSFGVMEVHPRQDGTLEVDCPVRLGPGPHPFPLVDAFDRAGHRASDAFCALGTSLAGCVVDEEAPRMSVACDEAPHAVVSDTSGETVFFARPLTLRFGLQDSTGVEDFTVTGGNEPACVRNRDGRIVGACLRVDEGVFDRSIVAEATDLVGNARSWSLAAQESCTQAGQTGLADTAELMLAQTHATAGIGHPERLVVDATAPELLFSPDTPSEGSYVRTDVTARVRVRDANLGYAAAHDGSQTVLTVERDGKPLAATRVQASYPGVDLGDTEHEYACSMPADRGEHGQDGRYTVHAAFTDPAGNAERAARSFVVDTTNPILSVSYYGADGENCSCSEGLWQAGEVTAVVSIVEKNFLDQTSGACRVRVSVEACDGACADEVVMGSWHAGTGIDEHRLEVAFPANGRFRLRVDGTDAAHNALEGAEVVDGAYDSGEFVCDSLAPQIEVRHAQQDTASEAGGVAYYNKPCTLEVRIRERNLDPSATTVTDSAGEERGVRWRKESQDADGTPTYVAHIRYEEGSGSTHAGTKEVVVHALDKAGNESAYEVPRFVVDETAPVVRAASCNKNAYVYGPDSAPWWFFNENDGVPARLSFSVADAYPLDGVWVSDPRGVYETHCDAARGKREARVIVTLKDGAANAEKHTDWERDVVLHVRDAAGNESTWSTAQDSSGPTLDNAGTHPVRIVYDSLPPVVSLSGVEESRCYAQNPVVRVAVSEHNFEALRRFDPSQTVLTIERRAVAQSDSWEVSELRADALCEVQGQYVGDHAFSEDGRFRLTARLEDLSHNASETVRIGEFVVDTTDPRIEVRWRDDGVRNQDDGIAYYDAPRVAIVTVVERNFDEKLVRLHTTGHAGAWQSVGDVHVCRVGFYADAPADHAHTLRVEAEDLAGNAAKPYEEQPFCIDTVSPTLEVLRRVSGEDRFALRSDEAPLTDGSAFSAGMAPVLVARDEANFDPSGLTLSLEGKRGPASPAPSFARTITPLGDGGLKVEWENLGLVSIDGMPNYELAADDVYTLHARVVDKAGNSSEDLSVSFSLNRYGSNFFFEDVASEDGLLEEPPLIVLHEINVSGASDCETEEGEAAHTVVKQYENASTVLKQVNAAEGEGYRLSESRAASRLNPYEGWHEYVYRVLPGNFGKGSSSDHGDGGQGLYRVDVSTRDKALNRNTTARYFASDAARTFLSEDDGDRREAQTETGKAATIEFTLDEYGPDLADVRLPPAFSLGGAWQASFRLVDDITRGDTVDVLLDGRRVPVYDESGSVVAKGAYVAAGTYRFVVDGDAFARPHTLEITVGDYTGRIERVCSVRTIGFVRTTLLGAVWSATGLGAVLACAFLVARRRGMSG